MNTSILFLLLSTVFIQQEAGINLLVNKSGLPLVTYCELVTNPEKFKDKLVRVKVSYWTGRHGGFLYDMACDGKGKRAVMDWMCDERTDCWVCDQRPTCDEFRKALARNLRRFGLEGRVELIVIGRFGSDGGYGKLVPYHEGFRYQLDVEKIERTFPISSDLPWPE